MCEHHYLMPSAPFLKIQTQTLRVNKALHCSTFTFTLSVKIFIVFTLVLLCFIVITLKRRMVLKPIPDIYISKMKTSYLNSQVVSHLATLGPAYNEFGYNEHPATTRNFFNVEKTPD